MSVQKVFNWNPDNNQLLIFYSGISFERIVFEINCGNELAVLEHPNQDKYPGQRISMVQVDVEKLGKAHRAAADATLKKDQRLNIRISSRDLKNLHARALEEGIPYQTFAGLV
jgi:predicted DNA binding CopG/RHH family protein